MKNMKQWLALALALVMTTGCLTACGKEKQADQETEKEAENSADTEDEAEDEKESEEASGEIETVKWVLFGDPQEDDETVLAEVDRLLREKYNVGVEFTFIAQGEYSDKMRLMSTSGEDYDLCFTSSWLNSYTDNLARDAFMPMNDLLETEAGGTLLAAMPEWLTSASTVNGNVYAIPNYQIEAVQLGYYIKKDLVEKYDLDLSTIKEVEDIEPFLETIKKNEPDLIPMSAEGNVFETGVWGDYECLFTREMQDGFVGVMGTTDVLEFGESEAYKESFRRLNEWYQKGYIRSDVAAVVDDSSDMLAGKYAVRSGAVKPGGDADFSAKWGNEYVSVGIGTPIIRGSGPAATMTAINVNSTRAEAAMKVISAFYTDEEIFNTFLFGLEGEHYTKVSDDRIEQIADSGYSRTSYGWAVGNQFNAWKVTGQDDDVWEISEQMNQEAVVSQLMGFSFDNTNVQAEVAQLTSVYNEYNKGWYYAEDFDAWWDEMYEKQKAAGLEKVGEELRSQIAAWEEANK